MRTGSDAERPADPASCAEDRAQRGYGGVGQGQLWLVGLGPGGRDHLTPAAAAALAAAEVVVGYKPYLEMVADLVADKRTVASGMRQETARAQAAVDAATAGARVAVLSSGDAGIYGMAGLLLELLPEDSGVGVKVVPGVTAASAVAGLPGGATDERLCRGEPKRPAHATGAHRASSHGGCRRATSWSCSTTRAAANATSRCVARSPFCVRDARRPRRSGRA